MSASKNSQSGFSLIELLVAVVILAVGLLGLAQLQVTAMRANSQTASTTAATAIAQHALEAVVAWGHNDDRLKSTQTGTFALADDGLGPTVTDGKVPVLGVPPVTSNIASAGSVAAISSIAFWAIDVAAIIVALCELALIAVICNCAMPNKPTARIITATRSSIKEKPDWEFFKAGIMSS